MRSHGASLTAQQARSAPPHCKKYAAWVVCAQTGSSPAGSEDRHLYSSSAYFTVKAIACAPPKLPSPAIASFICELRQNNAATPRTKPSVVLLIFRRSTDIAVGTGVAVYVPIPTSLTVTICAR